MHKKVGFKIPRTSRNIYKFPTVQLFTVGVTGFINYYEPLGF